MWLGVWLGVGLNWVNKMQKKKTFCIEKVYFNKRTQYGFLWPERFSCSNFPPYGPGQICMDEKKGVVQEAAPSNCSCVCSAPLLKAEGREIGGIRNCGLPCGLYKKQERRFGEYWVGFWSVMCFLVSLATLSTVALDFQRFKYPERPIFYSTFWWVFLFWGRGWG